MLIGSKFEILGCLGEINGNTVTFKKTRPEIAQSLQPCLISLFDRRFLGLHFHHSKAKLPLGRFYCRASFQSAEGSSASEPD
jgi:hypothetical protein